MKKVWQQWCERGSRVIEWLGLHHLPVLLAAVVLCGGAWVFVETADEVVEQEAESVDTRLMLALRSAADPSDPLGPDWVEDMMRDFTALGSFGVLTLITLFVLGYLLFRRSYHAAWLTLGAVGGGVLVSTLLKNVFDRPRPDLVPHEAIVHTASFPSGHSMMAAVTYLTLAALLAQLHSRRRIKAYLLFVALLLTVLVGVSRVYLGVHWPSDVLAGWTAGAAWAALAWLVAHALQRRGVVEGEDQPAEPPARQRNRP